jgi:hypothetical protein
MPKIFFTLVFAFTCSLYSAVSFAEPKPEPEPEPESEPAESSEPDHTQYELTVFTAKPGKLAAVHDWLRAHHEDVFAKHGATNIAYFAPAGPNPDSKILAIHRYPSLPALLKTSRAIKSDPLWKPMDTAENTPDALLESTTTVRLKPTDYSPEFTPSESQPPHVFELRTYTCPSPEKLFYLHDRFRDHTMGLFKKHGMENLVYWHPQDCDNADRMLIYLLAHKSEAAAKESFASFRTDPDWLAVKKASEEKAGGSLTNAERGVVSEFLEATEYSPLK